MIDKSVTNQQNLSILMVNENRCYADQHTQWLGDSMGHGDLLERLQGLETELHRLETRQNLSRLEQLLHPDFVEVARSGRRYSRSEVLAEFSGVGAALEPVRAEKFELAELSHGVALLTYSSAHERPSGELHRRTLRSSLWMETKSGWQLRFHQGTAEGSQVA